MVNGTVTLTGDNSILVRYQLMQDEIGAPLAFAEYADRSVQVAGVFGAGGTVTLEGSNDGTHWATLADPQGYPLVMTTNKIEAILECVRFVRPVAVGDGTTNLTVLVFGRKAK